MIVKLAQNVALLLKLFRRYSIYILCTTAIYRFILLEWPVIHNFLFRIFRSNDNVDRDTTCVFTCSHPSYSTRLQLDDYLEAFFDAVVDDEQAEDALASQHKEIHRRHVTNQLHRSKAVRRNGSTGCRILSHKSTRTTDMTTEAYKGA